MLNFLTFPTIYFNKHDVQSNMCCWIEHHAKIQCHRVKKDDIKQQKRTLLFALEHTYIHSKDLHRIAAKCSQTLQKTMFTNNATNRKK